MELAQKSWEFDNNIQLVDPCRDALYAHSYAEAGDQSVPRSNPRHFQRVRISAVALLKMVMHARTGGDLEIMGCMQGFVSADTFVITDAFRLPVEGTETRVNAQAEANEYLVSYVTSCRTQGRPDNVVGWYHSHPGYGCWLSGIDVETQSMQQAWNEPFVAIVIDPHRTISSGKVDIGAFRSLCRPSSGGGGGGSSHDTGVAQESSGGTRQHNLVTGSSIPTNKVDEFGAHANKYYKLEVSHFKSTLDTELLSSLWQKYWVQTLSQSVHLNNREFASNHLLDLSRKMRKLANIPDSSINRHSILDPTTAFSATIPLGAEDQPAKDEASDLRLQSSQNAPNPMATGRYFDSSNNPPTNNSNNSGDLSLAGPAPPHMNLTALSSVVDNLKAATNKETDNLLAMGLKSIIFGDGSLTSSSNAEKS